MAEHKALVPAARIERAILLIRGQKVMLDADLAELYQTQTRVLVQAVKRNLGRFPPDFMFQLSKEEADFLRSQIVTLRALLEDNLDMQFAESARLETLVLQNLQELRHGL